MILSQYEALAFLSKFKGSSVFVIVRAGFAPPQDRSLGALGFTSEVTLDQCDEHGLLLTWVPNGRLYLHFEKASFKYPDPDETALCGLQIALPEGMKCVVCPPGAPIRVIQ